MANAKFTRSISKFTRSLKRRTGVVVREVIQELGDEMLEMSPLGDPDSWTNESWKKWHLEKMGYEPGRYRANLQIGLGTIPADPIFEEDPVGSRFLKMLNELTSKSGSSGRIKLTDLQSQSVQVYFANTAVRRGKLGKVGRYASSIEEGWSPQAPDGVLGPMKDLFDRAFKEAVRKARGVK